MATLTWHVCKYEAHKLHQRRASFFQAIPLLDSYLFQDVPLMDSYLFQDVPLLDSYLFQDVPLVDSYPFSGCTSVGFIPLFFRLYLW